MATDPVKAAEEARRLRAAVWNFHRPMPHIPAGVCRAHFGFNDPDTWEPPRGPIEDGGYSDPTAPAPGTPAPAPRQPTGPAPRSVVSERMVSALVLLGLGLFLSHRADRAALL